MPRILSLFLALLAFANLASASEPELLEPEQAFAFSARAESASRLIGHFDIAPGYKLYRDKIRFEVEGASAVQAELPPGEAVKDPFLGEVQTYHGALEIPLRLEGENLGGKTVILTAHSQGCAEAGVCYPPIEQKVQLVLPASGIQGLKDLAKQIEGEQSTSAGEPLEPEQAFRFSSEMDGTMVRLRWDIAPHHYLYRDKLAIVAIEPKDALGRPTIPAGEEKNDPFLGPVRIFRDTLEVSVPVQNVGAGQKLRLNVTYQGCAEAGICYPPMEQQIELTTGSAAEAPSAATRGTELSEQDAIAEKLKSGSTWLAIGLFFLAGLGLALTPCVFPMIPILSGIIVGQGEQLTTRRAFALSLVYVLAMAVTYTVAGVLAGLFGSNLQAAFQNPWILSTFALVFVGLALSMFGFFELQLPSSLQSKISELSGRQQSGSFTGVAIMGLLSALIVGPCVAPPLAGALIYIGQTGDAVLGGTALFALSIGMGLPLIAVGTLGGKVLPRAGAWMNTVKAVFGVLMLGVAIWLLSRVLPDALTLSLWAMLLIASGIYLGALEPVSHPSYQTYHANRELTGHMEPVGKERRGWTRLWKALGLVLLAWGLLMLVGVATGQGTPLQPLRGLVGGGTAQAATAPSGLVFQRVADVVSLERTLAAAKAAGKPVMLDFYADWCVSCKEMEHSTFRDPAVRQAVADAVLLQADVTRNSADDKALLKRFGLIGPPAILFFTPDGQEQRASRVVGYKPPAEFAPLARRALGT
ncbi:MAG: protein-disulfide reductase DsbD [Gammaproteobacteria bacterium]|nr:protein-disulfide reductase DsbD [Gammaproteobacteria bacterium]